MKVKRSFFIGALAIAVIFLTLKQIGLIGLWTDGMAIIVDNTEKYTDAHGETVQGSYSVAIDLSDLESNIGKELYNDGTHRIYVSYLYAHSANSGGYLIGFRASGQSSLSGATLISAARHSTVNENSFTTTMSAIMTADYKGKSYTSGTAGLSGINYRDGDDFSFYIFPSEAYDSNEISLNETGSVTLTVTQLFKNNWSKKSNASALLTLAG